MVRSTLFWVAVLTAGLAVAAVASVLAGGSPTVCQAMGAC